MKITPRVSLELFSADDLRKLRNLGERIQRFNPKTGEQVWETAAWDSIRSDSHNLFYRIGSDALWIQGSPARVIGDGDAGFGSDAAAALDRPGCTRRMRDIRAGAIEFALPDIENWRVSRVDVTGNMYVGTTPPRVCESWRVLRDVEGGRYRVSQQAGDTIYWSSRSRPRAGKAYAKGTHLRYQMKQRT